MGNQKETGEASGETGGRVVGIEGEPRLAKCHKYHHFFWLEPRNVSLLEVGPSPPRLRLGSSYFY